MRCNVGIFVIFSNCFDEQGKCINYVQKYVFLDCLSCSYIKQNQCYAVRQIYTKTIIVNSSS